MKSMVCRPQFVVAILSLSGLVGCGQGVPEADAEEVDAVAQDSICGGQVCPLTLTVSPSKPEASANISSIKVYGHLFTVGHGADIIVGNYASSGPARTLTVVTTTTCRDGFDVVYEVTHPVTVAPMATSRLKARCLPEDDTYIKTSATLTYHQP